MQKNLTGIMSAAALVLLIPLFLTLLALWHWKPAALIFVSVLLVGGVGIAYQLVTKKIANPAYWIAVGVALLTSVVLLWMNVAVGGILGDDPANLMYFGVLFVGLIGALLGHLESRGMSRALFATAFAMALVPAIAWAIGTPAVINRVAAVFGLHAIFAVFFAGSGWLFLRANVSR